MNAKCRERPALRVDTWALLIAIAVVVIGLVLAHQQDTPDVDQQIFTDVIVGVQQGGDYYSVTDDVLADTYGVRMGNFRAYRLPTLYVFLSAFDKGVWVFLAAAPALAMAVGAILLAGTDALTQRIAAVLAGMWILASLPRLYLYAELWAGPFLVFAGIMVRQKREGRAAVLCLVGALIRELLFAGIVVGIFLALVGRRDSLGTWMKAAVAFIVAMLVHIYFVSSHLDPNGGIPALGNAGLFDWIMISPGTSDVAIAIGPPLVALAFVGLWLRRDDPAFRYLGLYAVPMVVATLLADRGYWSLTWSGVTSAAAAVTLAHLYRMVRNRSWTQIPILGGDGATTPRRHDP